MNAVKTQFVKAYLFLKNKKNSMYCNLYDG